MQRHIVTLRDGDGFHRLLLCHGILGDPWSFLPLMTLIPKAFSIDVFTGNQPPYLTPNEAIKTVSQYIYECTQSQKIVLGGYCYGAMLALNIFKMCSECWSTSFPLLLFDPVLHRNIIHDNDVVFSACRLLELLASIFQEIRAPAFKTRDNLYDGIGSYLARLEILNTSFTHSEVENYVRCYQMRLHFLGICDTYYSLSPDSLIFHSTNYRDLRPRVREEYKNSIVSMNCTHFEIMRTLSTDSDVRALILHLFQK